MLVTVGRIGRAHGVRGDLVVDVRTDTPELRFVEGATLATEPESAGPLTVTRVRWHSGRLLLQFAGVTDRTGAETLRGVRLLADTKDDSAPTEPDEYYDHELVGLQVHTVAGELVGEVGEVVHLPGQDLLAVRRTSGEVLVPFVAAIVPDVDLGRGVVTIDPPEGLLA